MHHVLRYYLFFESVIRCQRGEIEMPAKQRYHFEAGSTYLTMLGLLHASQHRQHYLYNRFEYTGVHAHR
jgi:hypothetical protein